MTPWTLTKQSLRFYWRTHLGVVLGAAVATTVLAGSLVIGDSVSYSLRRFALDRLGETRLALQSEDRFFRAPAARGGAGAGGLAAELAADLGVPVAPVLQLRGAVWAAGGGRRVNQAQVLGVDERFWRLGGTGPPLPAPAPDADPQDIPDEVALNSHAAARLGVGPGARIMLQIEKPGAMPGDTALGSDLNAADRIGVTVRAVVSDAEFGRFGLQADQLPPDNVFVPLAWLQAKAGVKDGANVLLVGKGEGGEPSAEAAERAIRRRFQVEDAGLEVRNVPNRDALEVRTGRVFLDAASVQAAREAEPDAVGVLTYFVNELAVGGRSQWYSMVTAMGPLEPGRPAAWAASYVPRDMRDDEALINWWLEADIGAKVGDTLRISYYVLGQTNRLETRSAEFRIRGIVLEGAPAVDPTLMPPFPGIADETDCRKWRSDIVDLSKVRAAPGNNKDQVYWDKYHGTPKAFVTLAAGRKMWSNRFGNLTAIRYPAEGRSADGLRVGIRDRLRLHLAALGFHFREVRQAALKASAVAIDFTNVGVLFFLMSMFLVVAALVLMGLLFVFGVEQRSEEVGTLLAVGLLARKVRRLLLAEGAALAVVGAAAGLVAGLVYTYLMLRLLETFWKSAVGGMSLYFHAGAATLVAGAVSGIAAAVIAILVTLWRQARRPARELLAGGAELSGDARARGRLRLRIGLAVGAAATLGAVLIIALTGSGGQSATGAFFGAGALLLVAGLAFVYAALGLIEGDSGRAALRLGGLGVRNAARRRGRSIATVALIACGSFLVVAVGVFRQDPLQHARERTSGTGGFALWGESALPIYRDPNDSKVRADRHVGDLGGAKVTVVALRVREGDEASCLNLNHPQQPRLMGLGPEEMAADGGRFSFTGTVEDTAGKSPWTLLARESADGAVPAIADAATITWSLQKKVGDTLSYTDEQGRPFEVRLVAAIAPSMLQGGLFVSERALLAHFPSVSGYRMFLVDVDPPSGETRAAEALMRGFQREGLSLVPATERLGEFFAVNNTYVSIFQVLGGLGMVLGSVGLGLVVLRNVLERRGELAILRAVGFRRSELRRLVLWEHWGLLLAGLAIGAAAAGVAVLPALGTSGRGLPMVSLGLTLAGILASGLLWTHLAAAAALRGPLLDALRNE